MQIRKDCALLEKLEVIELLDANPGPSPTPSRSPTRSPTPNQVIDYSMLVGIHRTSSKGVPPASEQRRTSTYHKVGSGAHGARGGGGGGGGAEGSAVGSREDTSSEAGDSSVAGGGMGEGAARREAAVRITLTLTLAPALTLAPTLPPALPSPCPSPSPSPIPSPIPIPIPIPSPSPNPNPDPNQVRILDTVSQEELHEEQLKRTPAPRGRGGGPEESGGEIYFVGLIDILCEYGLKKQLEHHYKASQSVSQSV